MVKGRHPGQARRSLLALLLLLWCEGLSVSQTVRQPTELLEKLLMRMRTFAPASPVRFSPDGKMLAYTLIESRGQTRSDLQTWLRTGIPWYGDGGQVYVSNVVTGQSTDLTSAQGDNWLPTWSSDGHYLAFLSDRDGSGQAKLWIWDAETNRIRKTSEVGIRGDYIQWMPDSKSVLVTTPADKVSRKRDQTTGAPIDARSEAKHWLGPAVTLYGSMADTSTTSGPWDLDEQLRQLTLIRIEDGSSEAVIRARRIAKFLLSPDGSRVAYTVPTRFEKQGSQQILFDLDVITIGASQNRVVASNIRLEYDGDGFSWSPDGRRLAFCTGGFDEIIGDCYVIDLRDGNKRNVSMFAPATTSRASQDWTKPIWNSEGKKIYFVHEGKLWQGALTRDRPALISQIANHRIIEVAQRANRVLWTSDSRNSTVVLTYDDVGQQDGFYKIDLTTGRATPLLERGQCYSCVSQSPHIAFGEDGGQAAYLAEDASHYPDLWLTDSDFTHSRRLTATNPEMDKCQLGKGRLIEWLSDAGETLKGALLLPADYKQGERYPLLVWVYGGSRLSDHFDRFGLGYASPFNMQLFAMHGYAVLLPDAPESVGTPMLDLARSVLPGINRAIELGIADPDRLGIFGHSNGGYSTTALIVQTRRFKAAIDISGTANLLGLYTEMAKDGTAYGTAIVEHGQDALGGTPWEFRDRYIENSPIFYLDHVSTPLLIVHGSEDTAVPSFLSDELFIGLRRLGRRVEYAKYQGEGHSPADWSYADQLDLCNRMLAWFDSYLNKPQ